MRKSHCKWKRALHVPAENGRRRAGRERRGRSKCSISACLARPCPGSRGCWRDGGVLRRAAAGRCHTGRSGARRGARRGGLCDLSGPPPFAFRVTLPRFRPRAGGLQAPSPSFPPARPPAGGGCGTKAAARALGFDGERFGRRCDSLPPSDLGGDWGARRAVCRWACTYSRRKKEAAGVQRVYCESFLASLALLRKDLCIFIEYSRRMRILVIMDYAAHAKRRKKSASSS